MRKVQIALLVVLLPCILPRVLKGFPSSDLRDFRAYYTAAILVSQHTGTAMYSGVNTQEEQPSIDADPKTQFGQAAQLRGIPHVLVYIYPPILADLLIPLAPLSAAVAGKIWVIFNVAVLIASGLLLVALLNLRWFSWGSLAIMGGLVCFPPAMSAINLGNIANVLCFLWVCGIYFYALGWRAAAGAVFALATAIKLTPLIVILPLVVWREWRVLQGFLAALGAIAVLICVVNTPASLQVYFLQIMPYMARGVPSFFNWSVEPCIERLFIAFHLGAIFPSAESSGPRTVQSLAKLCSVAIVAVAALVVYRLRFRMGLQDKIMSLALFAVLTACISPVSWAHAYEVTFIALALSWGQALREPANNYRLLLLVACSFGLTTFVYSLIMKILLRPNPREILASLLLLTIPAAGVVLTFLNFSQMQSTAPPSPGALEILPVASS